MSSSSDSSQDDTLRLPTGIYSVEDMSTGMPVAYGSLAPKFRGLSQSFMVTNISGTGMKLWCADLVHAGQVPDGQEHAGKLVFALHGHPFQNVFVVDGDDLIECSKDWVERHTWIYHHELHGQMLREPAAPPVPSLKFPSDNFKDAVIDKNPALNEPYSPSTQTIVEACANHKQELPTESEARQKELVRLYTKETPLYHEMNEALRDDNLDRMRYFGAYIKELRDVFKTDHIDQIIDPFEGKVWRGITFPDVEAALKGYEEGCTFVWPAFTSMSTEQAKAMNFGNCVFEISCHPPTGHYDDEHPEYAPASVQEWSVYPTEKEILFPPNVKFRVLSIRHPDSSNGLSKPLIVCETVGLDTDRGIVEFKGTEQQEEEMEQEADEGDMEGGDDLARLWKLVKEQSTETEHLREQVQQCLASVQTCNSGIEVLQAKVDDMDRRLSDCATQQSVTSIMESLTGEKDARLKADEVAKEIQKTLGSDGQKLLECQTLCKDLETRVVDVSNMMSAEQASVQQNIKDSQAALEQKLGELQSGLEIKIGELSTQVGMHIQQESRCFHDIDGALQGLTERCYLTNMILATEKLKQETHSLSHGQDGAAGDAHRITCDVASKGMSEIGATLENLRHRLSVRRANGADHALAAGGALQAARAVRRPSPASS